MKRIIECDLFSRDYNIGDVVYLAKKFGKISCRAVALSEVNGKWFFKPLEVSPCYVVRNGLIRFDDKPFIFAKEIEEEEAQP